MKTILDLIFFITFVAVSVVGTFDKLAYLGNAVFPKKDNYKGVFMGNLQTYKHYVNGSVYAVDAETLLIEDFNYDGMGGNARFRIGTRSGSIPNNGYIGDEIGSFQPLKANLKGFPTHRKAFTLSLKSMQTYTHDLIWFAVYNFDTQEPYGYLNLVPGNRHPSITTIFGSFFVSTSNQVSIDYFAIIDHKTIRLINFNYDGKGGNGVYFYIGRGIKPHSLGVVVPNEHGYIEPLRQYYGKYHEDITLTLPGDITIFDIDWFSVYDTSRKKSFGHIMIPTTHLNVPPSLHRISKLNFRHRNCRMLHSNLAVAWTARFPNVIIHLMANISRNGYVAFGFSPNSTMTGSDVALVYVSRDADEKPFHLEHMDITGKASCSQIHGKARGVCPHQTAHGEENLFQPIRYFKRNGISNFVFMKKMVKLTDWGIFENSTSLPNSSIVWALGEMIELTKTKKAPWFHHTYPKENIIINLNDSIIPTMFQCRPFVLDPLPMMDKVKDKGNTNFDRPIPLDEPWPPHLAWDHKELFFSLGPSGGEKGFGSMTGYNYNPPYVWYMNRWVAAHLFLVRGLTYNFTILGGNDPEKPEFYNPFVISDDPIGGYERFTKLKNEIRIYAGLEGSNFTALGHVVCQYRRHIGDRMTLDINTASDLTEYTNSGICEPGTIYPIDPYYDFFKQSLVYECSQPWWPSTSFTITPNASWPDELYYNSYTNPYMGYKITIKDSSYEAAKAAKKIWSVKNPKTFCSNHVISQDLDPNAPEPNILTDIGIIIIIFLIAALIALIGAKCSIR